MAELSVHAERIDGRAVLALAGELDLATVPQLRNHSRAALADDGVAALALDLGGLTFLDSSGLGLLVELRNLAIGAGRTIEIVNVPPAAARVMTIAGLGETFGLPPGSGEEPG